MLDRVRRQSHWCLALTVTVLDQMSWIWILFWAPHIESVAHQMEIYMWNEVVSTHKQVELVQPQNLQAKILRRRHTMSVWVRQSNIKRCENDANSGIYGPCVCVCVCLRRSDHPIPVSSFPQRSVLSCHACPSARFNQNYVSISVKGQGFLSFCHFVVYNSALTCNVLFSPHIPPLGCYF